MARGNFGERLKRERELREVSLNEVTVATRIGTRFLEALENEDWQKLPGGVFNRGFVRSVARYLGLDEENLLAEYDMARGDQVPEAVTLPEKGVPTPPKWVAPAAVLGMLLLLAVLVAAAVYGWRRYVVRGDVKQSSATLARFAVPVSSAVLLELNGPVRPLMGSFAGHDTIGLSAKYLRQPHAGNSQS